MTITPRLAAGHQFAGDLQRGHARCARRNPDQHPLFPRQPAHHRVRVFGLDPDIAVGQRGIVNARDDRGRHVLQAFQPVKAGGGLRRDSTSRAAVRGAAAGVTPMNVPLVPMAGDEMRHAAIGLLDDLGPGAFEVRLPVGGVVVLVRIEIAVGIGLVDLAALADRAVRTLAADR